MKGFCLCGAVTITAPDNTHLSACHCGMCRRWSGGPALAFHGGPDIEIDGEDKISRFPSSEWAERAFCSCCGTHLYYKLLATGDHYLYPGFFGDDQTFTLTGQIYIDMKPPFYEFANETENLTEAQVLARFAPPA